MLFQPKEISCELFQFIYFLCRNNKKNFIYNLPFAFKLIHDLKRDGWIIIDDSSFISGLTYSKTAKPLPEVSQTKHDY